MSPQNARNSLRILLDAHDAPEKEITHQEPIRQVNSDDEADSACPVLSWGNELYCPWASFSVREIRWIHYYQLERWSSKKIITKPLDFLVMLLAVLKHGESWDLLAKDLLLKDLYLNVW